MYLIITLIGETLFCSLIISLKNKPRCITVLWPISLYGNRIAPDLQDFVLTRLWWAWDFTRASTVQLAWYNRFCLKKVLPPCPHPVSRSGVESFGKVANSIKKCCQSYLSFWKDKLVLIHLRAEPIKHVTEC